MAGQPKKNNNNYFPRLCIPSVFVSFILEGRFTSILFAPSKKILLSLLQRGRHLDIQIKLQYKKMLWVYFLCVTTLIGIVQSVENFSPTNSRFAREAVIRIQQLDDKRRVSDCCLNFPSHSPVLSRVSYWLRRRGSSSFF